MQYWVVGLFVSLAACTFDSSAVGVGGRDGASIDAPSDDDASVIDGSVDAGVLDAGSADAPTPDAMQLVGANPITRHYIDEAASDEATLLVDALAPPTNLTVTTDSELGKTVPVYVMDGNDNRGIFFASEFNQNVDDANSDTRASVQTTAELHNAFHKKTEGTLELVVDIEEFSGMGRLLYLGHANDSDLALHADEQDITVLTFTMRHNQTMSWNLNVAGAGRVLLHVVIDTTQDLDANRVQLYLNGALQVGIPGVGSKKIDKDTEIRFHGQPADHHFALGNREVGGRPVNGAFYYMALYASALTAAQVGNNAAVLLINDDAP